MNTFNALVNICREPEALELGGRAVKKLRVACSTPGKNSETRFIDAIVSGADAELVERLAVGDQVWITGTLQLSSYVGKKGKNAGQKVQTDQMPFAKILQVTRSKKFFEGLKSEEMDSTAPDITVPPAVSPLADLLDA